MTDTTTIETAAIEFGTVQPLPLDRLILSELNVRKTERDADIEGLAEDIAARGLKQNLVVIPAHFTTGDRDAGSWEGKFEVVAGGRRYQALQLLAEAGRIAADHAVPCMIEAREDARETSLSENLQRVAMNPADEFDAFAVIVQQHRDRGESEETARDLCARRFGKTARYVAGRLRLASLAPEILEALRTDKIGIESAKAYAGTEDHRLQVKVFAEQEKVHWQPHRPDAVRDRLRGNTCSLEDPRVIYVGLDAYREAGGLTEVEMFMGTDGEERIVNVPLLAKLAKAKAEAALPAIAKRAGYKDAVFATGTSWNPNWPKAPEGFERTWEYGSHDLTKSQKKKSIAVYAIRKDGKGLEYAGRFKSAENRRPQQQAETAEERAERVREYDIRIAAARLAVGPFAGSPFEGRAFWPAQFADPVEYDTDNWEIEEGQEDGALVAVLVRVTQAEIDAQREAAERQVDAEIAARVAEEAPREAARTAAADGAE